jgi:hypothetical protein
LRPSAKSAGLLRLAELEPPLGHLAHLEQLVRRDAAGPGLERGAVEQGELAGAVGGRRQVRQVDQRAGARGWVGDCLGDRGRLLGVGGGQPQRRLAAQEVGGAFPLEPRPLHLIEERRGIEPA